MSGDQVPTTRPHDKLRRVLGPVVAPFYGAVVAYRNGRFDRGVGVKRVPVPVISVGNLTTGGTGKTPFVMWLCRELTARGVKPVIAMRGYGSEKNNGRSDEAEEYRAAMPQVPVIVNPDRHAGITAFLASGGAADVIVLDDGFQHRRLHRDVDIVLVDAQAGTPTDRLLPTGNLREPVAGIARAGVVVLTHAEHGGAADSTEQALRPYLAQGTVVARAEHRWADLVVNDAGAVTTWRVPWLRGKHVVAVCGIARPQGFLQALSETGCKMQKVYLLSDHQAVGAAFAEQVAQTAADTRARIIVTTQKDYARMATLPNAWAALTLVRPVLELAVDQGAAIADRVLAAVGAGKTAR